MSEQIEITKFNLVDFIDNHWSLCATVPEYLPAQHIAGRLPLTHNTMFVIVAAYRKACEELHSSPNGAASFYERQFAFDVPDNSAPGDENVYNLAIEKLDAALMSGPRWQEKPMRMYGKDHPEGEPVTLLRRPRPEIESKKPVAENPPQPA